MTPIYVTQGMLASGRPIAQGEVLIWAREHAPRAVADGLAALTNMKPLKLEGGAMILGHSETGHHHVLEPVDKAVPISQAALALIDAANDMFVELRLMSECKLVHQRADDTHETLIFPPGEYIRAIRQEQRVEGWVRSID